MLLPQPPSPGRRPISVGSRAPQPPALLAPPAQNRVWSKSEFGPQAWLPESVAPHPARSGLAFRYPATARLVSTGLQARQLHGRPLPRRKLPIHHGFRAGRECPFLLPRGHLQPEFEAHSSSTSQNRQRGISDVSFSPEPASENRCVQDSTGCNETPAQVGLLAACTELNDTKQMNLLDEHGSCQIGNSLRFSVLVETPESESDVSFSCLPASLKWRHSGFCCRCWPLSVRSFLRDGRACFLRRRSVN